jgi:hypothetical protein
MDQRQLQRPKRRARAGPYGQEAYLPDGPDMQPHDGPPTFVQLPDGPEAHMPDGPEGLLQEVQPRDGSPAFPSRVQLPDGPEAHMPDGPEGLPEVQPRDGSPAVPSRVQLPDGPEARMPDDGPEGLPQFLMPGGRLPGLVRRGPVRPGPVDAVLNNLFDDPDAWINDQWLRVPPYMRALRRYGPPILEGDVP